MISTPRVTRRIHRIYGVGKATLLHALKLLANTKRRFSRLSTWLKANEVQGCQDTHGIRFVGDISGKALCNQESKYRHFHTQMYVLRVHERVKLNPPLAKGVAQNILLWWVVFWVDLVLGWLVAVRSVRLVRFGSLERNDCPHLG